MATGRGVNKDIRALLRRAKRAGCHVRMARSGHYRITGPSGGAITVASTPRRPALDRIRADLRRIGTQL